MPAWEELPGTLERSPNARRTGSTAHDRAVETHAEGERSPRTAFAAPRRTFEQVGDRNGELARVIARAQ